MLPYLELPDVRLGSWALDSWGLLAVLGIGCGYLAYVRRCRRSGLDPALTSRLYIWTVVWGYAGAHLAPLLIRTPSALAEHPSLLIEWWRGVYSFGGLLGGLAGLLWFARLERLAAAQRWAYLDHAAYVLPLVVLFGRAACGFTHHHPGMASSSWLAVRFPGVPRYDLALLEFLYAVMAAFAFHVLDRRPRAPGFYFALFSLSYGLMRLFLSSLEVEPVSSVTGLGAVGACLLGLAAAVRLRAVRAG
ncbi:MAG: prolipoprotein diacylglyceryl transferase [Acidobacteria bacterium]|nr:prolipoprotein diacylglyceryl transferase [Acidobacteriota bacterium]